LSFSAKETKAGGTEDQISKAAMTAMKENFMLIGFFIK
jgi:hypothetical protein